MSREPDKKKMYFIAIIPPAPLYDDLVNMKTYLSEKYKTKAALKSPPHITLHMPFWYREEKETELAENLSVFSKVFDPIRIMLDNFSSFPPRVIFLNVVQSDALQDLQQKLHKFCKISLNVFNANYKDQPFNPHITLAFRDLKKAAYKEAWEEFKSKEYKAEFVADKVALMKHNGDRWEVFKTFTLESSYSTDVKEDLATTEG